MAAADEKESQLDLSKSVNVWMIRVPNYLAERWDAVSAAGADVEIGTLRIFKKADGSKRPKIELRVSESLQAAGDHALPPVLEVQTTDDTPKGLNVISETKSGKYCVANEGEIALRGTCTCKDTALYSKLKKKKETQPRTLLPEVDRVVLAPTDIKTGRKEVYIAERMASEELRHKLFELFQAHEFYKLDDLKEQTGQPKTALQDILREIAEYETTGPNKHRYHLKSEFKTW
eukprot:m.131338 g.131338  ORF g.131338 m.131338 type:complete len:232 (-) comp20017_c1_seq2:117-812(-)